MTFLAAVCILSILSSGHISDFVPEHLRVLLLHLFTDILPLSLILLSHFVSPILTRTYYYDPSHCVFRYVTHAVSTSHRQAPS